MEDPADAEQAKRERTEAFAVAFAAKFEKPEVKARMTEMSSTVATGFAQIREQFQSFAAAYANIITEIRKGFASAAEAMAPTIEMLREGLRRAPEAIRSSALTLAQEGWFVSPGMSLVEPLEAAALFSQGRAAEAEAGLADYFERRLDQIEAILTIALPKRAKLISSAFAAHRAGHFELSIPVLLAQADGVCVDIAQRALFMSERGRKKADRRPEVAAYVESFEHDLYWSALLSPLGKALPINATPSERGEGFKGLNRNMVMHGESVDYGTRINSLKCVSLLGYATWVLGERQSRNEAMAQPMEAIDGRPGVR